MNPKLSIIIPCYNCAHVIEDLLVAFKKNFHEDVEYIFIDDGSTDNTQLIVSEFIKTIDKKNFLLIGKENEGAAKTRQYGLEIAKGDFVFFCDSDDLIVENFVKSILKELANTDVDIIAFNSIVEISEENKSNFYYKVKFEKENFFTCNNEYLEKQLDNNYWTAAVWTFLFRRKIANESGAYFTNRKAHEDHMFVMMILNAAKKIRCLDKIMYIQRVRSGSLTNSIKSWDYIHQRYIAFEEVNKKFQVAMGYNLSKKYRYWSLFSFLSIIGESKRNFLLCILNPKFYFIMLSNLDFIVYSLYKKVKRVLS